MQQITCMRAVLWRRNTDVFQDKNRSQVRDILCFGLAWFDSPMLLGIFPDFNADENDPASYDFALTDTYLSNIIKSGAQVFFRLGNKIEHWHKHYGIMPPADYHKWARVCEHIILHYNFGWANGFNMNIKYWEIWNEPDFNDKCWLGTPEEFYELFAVAAKHLKKCFPDLKIGGPAVCGYNEKWLRPFFEYMRNNSVPIDFYSWHRYAYKVEDFSADARRHRSLLDEFGYTETESILNEWNYVLGWGGAEWKQSVKTIGGIKGAAFISAVMTECQHTDTDMLMYYDARINCTMNGIFSFGTFEPIKGYYPVKVWGEMLSMGQECKSECDVPDIYAVCASDGSKLLTMVTYYTPDENAVPRSFKVDFGAEYGDRLLSIYTLDSEHDFALTATAATDSGEFYITMRPNTAVVIR